MIFRKNLTVINLYFSISYSYCSSVVNKNTIYKLSEEMYLQQSLCITLKKAYVKIRV